MDNLIVVKQLPIIEEQLKAMSGEIDKKVEFAKSLVCTDETVKEIKKIRAELNNDFKALEEKRKEVKSAVLEPYNDFETTYKLYVSDKFKSADNDLKSKIDDVENELKKQKEDEIRLFFEEYRGSCNIDFVKYEDAEISVTLSASMKSLKEKAKSFIDRINDDLALIDTQEHKAEIMVEYKKSLNCSQAITTVKTRLKAIEEHQKMEAERLAKIEAQNQAATKVEVIVPEIVELAPAVEVPVKEEVKREVIAANEDEYELTFKVTATMEKLKALKQFLNEGGYKYE